MKNNRTFAIAAIGLAGSDLRLLKTLCTLSATRVRAYALAEAGTAPDIYVVDGDNAESVVPWKALYARRAAPTLMVCKNAADAAPHYTLQRPLVSSRLFAILDKISAKELNFFPELVIGGEDLGCSPVTTKTSVPKGFSERFRVLVVDDSVTVRKQLELGLRLALAHVDCAETAEDAIRLLAANHYDLAFLDVVLPGMDGYQLCKRIKADKTKKQMPVIMLTGKSSPFDRVRGALSGCDSYLVKPLENEKFQETIRKHLAERPGPGRLAMAPQ